MTVGQDAQPHRRRPPLDRKTIAASAVKLLEEVGVDKLTMRGLAERLGVSAMALYHHVEDKDDLLRLVGDELLGRIELPDIDSAPWPELFVWVTDETIDVLMSVPGLSTVLLSSSLLPNARRLVRYNQQLLTRAGIDEHQANLVLAGVHHLALGRLVFAENAHRNARKEGSRGGGLPGYSSAIRSRDSFDAALRALLAPLLTDPAKVTSSA